MMEEFFEGETEGIVTEILRDYISKHPNELRRIDLLSEYVRYHGKTDRRRETVKAVLKGYKRMNSQLRKQLTELNIEVLEGKTHYKLRYHGDPRYQCIMSKTGSDKKAGDNLAAKIGKMCF